MKHDFGPALMAGVAGASAVTLLNQAARHTVPNAPRLDILGMRGTAAGARMLGLDPPENLQAAALAGDMCANTSYYALVGSAGRSNAIVMGAALGFLAGMGAALLPSRAGFGKGPTERTPATAGMAMGWYLAGGLVAGLVYRATAKD